MHLKNNYRIAGNTKHLELTLVKNKKSRGHEQHLSDLTI